MQVAILLKKDELNAYGIMAPSDREGERRIRGSGLYINSSLINHEVCSVAGMLASYFLFVFYSLRYKLGF